jgi:TrmH family RNA methyltransferase
MKLQPITSAQNPRVKAAIRLKSGRGRKTQRRLIIYGKRELMRAAAAGISIVETFVCPPMLERGEIQELLAALPQECVVYELTADLMQRLRYGERVEGVVAVAQRPEWTTVSGPLNSLDEASPLVVVLESVEKPGNIGAVLRSLDGAGGSAAIITDPQCDPFHPNCIRSSMGSVFTVPLAVASAAETLAWCAQRNLSLYALRDQGDAEYTAIDWTGPSAIVLGNEASGLSATWQKAGARSVRIPMAGIADSLNLSVAAAVVLYEARRQRERFTDRTDRAPE